MTKTAMAIAAHPDDIEFFMAGTLLLLKQNGYQIHCKMHFSDHQQVVLVVYHP